MDQGAAMEKNEFHGVSGQLTPNEIKNREFGRSVMGYSPKEVVAFLDTTAKTWEKVQKHEKELLEKMRLMSVEIKEWQYRGVELEGIREKVLQDVRKMQEEAETEAAKMFAEVESRATEIRLKTEGWLTELIAEVKETERQKSNFLIAFKSALDSHYELIKEEQQAKEPLSARLTHFLQTNLGGGEPPNEIPNVSH